MDHEVERFVGDNELFVLENLLFLRPCCVATNLSMTAWQQFARNMEVKKAKPGDPDDRVKRRRLANREREEWEQAWLRLGRQPPRRADAAPHESTAEARDAEPIDEDAAWEIVQSTKEWLLKHDTSAESDDFYITVRGTKWTWLHLRQPWDALQCKTRAGWPNIFVGTYGFQVTKRFGRKAYGRDACLRLCCAWCAKMQYLYSWWKEHTGGDVDAVSPEEVLSGYDDLEFVNWGLEQGPESKAWNQVMEIRAMRPWAPVATDSEADA